MKSFGTPPPQTGLTLHRFPLLNLSSQHHCFSHEIFNGLSSGQCPPNVHPNRFSAHLKVTGLHLVSPNLAVSIGVDFRLAVWKVVSLFKHFALISTLRSKKTKQVAWLFGAALCLTLKDWKRGRRGRSCFAWLWVSAWRSPASWLRILQKTLPDDRTRTVQRYLDRLWALTC